MNLHTEKLLARINGPSFLDIHDREELEDDYANYEQSARLSQLANLEENGRDLLRAAAIKSERKENIAKDLSLQTFKSFGAMRAQYERTDLEPVFNIPRKHRLIIELSRTSLTIEFHDGKPDASRGGKISTLVEMVTMERGRAYLNQYNRSLFTTQEVQHLDIDDHIERIAAKMDHEVAMHGIILKPEIPTILLPKD